MFQVKVAVFRGRKAGSHSCGPANQVALCLPGSILCIMWWLVGVTDEQVKKCVKCMELCIVIVTNLCNIVGILLICIMLTIQSYCTCLASESFIGHRNWRVYFSLIVK